MRLVFAFSPVFALAACASHIKTEMVGGGRIAPGATGVQLARGTYDFALHFDVPRAQVIEYLVSCPGVEQRGSIGETFEAYRERRLGELRAQAANERHAVESLTGALGVHAQAGNAAVDAKVSGSAVADAVVQQPVELPAGDVGAARLSTHVQIVTATDGACTVTANGEPMQAGFEITRFRDLDAEAREKAQIAQTHALEVRGALSAHLVTVGADPLARQRRAEAEARARAEAEAKLHAQRDAEARAQLEVRTQVEAKARVEAELRARAEAKARAEAELRAQAEAHVRMEAEAHARAEAEAHARVEARARAEAEAKVRARLALQWQITMEARGALSAYLVACGADLQHRARVRAELEAQLRLREEQRRAREAAIEEQRRAREAAIEEQRRAREAAIEEQRRAREAAIEEQRRAREAILAHRIELALNVRAELTAYLVTLGARERPPMPAAIAENPGVAPFAGAEWIAGHWVWTGGQWQWTGGGWRDTAAFGAAGNAGGAISVGTTSTSGGAIIDTSIELPGAAIVVSPASAADRDHRTPPVERDHRTAPAPTAPTAPAAPPTVRDHRTAPSAPTAPTATSRDHRKPDPDVRDHRK